MSAVTKLNLELAREIRRLYSTGRGAPSLANEFGVSESTIYGVVSNYRWREPGTPNPAATLRNPDEDTLVKAVRARVLQSSAGFTARISEARAGLDELQACAETDATAAVLSQLTGAAPPPSRRREIVAAVIALLRSLVEEPPNPRYAAKLTPELAAEVRRDHREGVPMRELARRLGVSRSSIKAILEGRTHRQ